LKLTDYLLEKCLLDLSLAKSEIVKNEHKRKLETAKDLIREIITERYPF